MTQTGPRQPGRFAQPYRPTTPSLSQSFPPLPAGLVPLQRSRPPVNRRPTPPRNGFGGSALVLAVAGLAVGLVPLAGSVLGPLVGPVVIACGLVGSVLGVLGLARVRRKVATNRAASVAGTVGSVLALLLGAWGTALTLGLLDPADDAGSDELTAVEAKTSPAVAPRQLEDGAFEIGSAVVPGTYRTAGPRQAEAPSCFWARLRDTSGEFSSIIATGNAPGADQVTIAASDGAFSTSGCQPWTKVR